MGLNAALATATRSLEIFTAGIQVAGQNIANADTPGYIRESLNLESNLPYRSGSLVLGTGVLATGVVQTIDQFLETRIHRANSEFTASEAREEIYKQLEFAIGELSDSDLSTSLNDFLATVNDLVNQPESGPTRQLAVQQGQTLADDISSLRLRVDDIRKNHSIKLDQLVDEANRLIDQIAELNPQIVKLESAGLLQSDAGALRTQRYGALNRLSEIVPIRYIERDDGGVDVFTDTDYLVITGQTQQLETYTVADRDVSVKMVRLSNTKSELSAASAGEIRGIIEGRDEVLGGFVDDLNAYTSSLIHEFNRIHSSGEGLQGFTSLTAQTPLDDPSALLNAAGLAFTPKHGSFQLKVTNSATGATTTSNIAVDLDGIGADTTLEDLRAAIDGVANLSASLTVDGRLQIQADSNFEFRFADDTSGALAALGINTFFTGSDSSSIGVNATVANNHAYFASSQGGGPSDNRNALLLAEFFNNPVAGLNGNSLDEFYETTIAGLAQASASETTLARGFEAFRDSLQNQRLQFSGVSLDEEVLRVLDFQRSYQAAARLISTIDELFTILLNV